jgi:hypothetical protein
MRQRCQLYYLSVLVFLTPFAQAEHAKDFESWATIEAKEGGAQTAAEANDRYIPKGTDGGKVISGKNTSCGESHRAHTTISP